MSQKEYSVNIVNWHRNHSTEYVENDTFLIPSSLSLPLPTSLSLSFSLLQFHLSLTPTRMQTAKSSVLIITSKCTMINKISSSEIYFCLVLNKKYSYMEKNI